MMKPLASHPTSYWLVAGLLFGASAFTGCSRGGASSYGASASSTSATSWQEPAPAASSWGERAEADRPRLREEPAAVVRSDRDLWFMRSASNLQPARQETSFSNDPRFENPRVEAEVPRIVPPQPPGQTVVVQPIRQRPTGWRNRLLVRAPCE
jgi:hypothetical protein